MSEKYILTESDLHVLLGFKLCRVENSGLTWLYSPNPRFGGKTPKEAIELEHVSFDEYEAVFAEQFGHVDLIIPIGMFSAPMIAAIFERYPLATLKET